LPGAFTSSASGVLWSANLDADLLDPADDADDDDL